MSILFSEGFSTDNSLLLRSSAENEENGAGEEEEEEQDAEEDADVDARCRRCRRRRWADERVHETRRSDRVVEDLDERMKVKGRKDEKNVLFPRYILSLIFI